MSVINDMISRVLNVRSMAAADLPRVLQLEKQRLRSSWLQHDIASNSPARDRGTWVATIQNHVVGYLVYQLITEPETSSSKVAGKAAKLVEAETMVAPPMVCVDLLHIFVAPDWRRRGIGKALVTRFDPRPAQKGTCVIEAAVPERDMPVQFLLRATGFKAVCVMRGFYGDDDAYLMEKRFG
jgi:[ribosomal protein S18]-alanine N-acetyltransferase